MIQAHGGRLVDRVIDERHADGVTDDISGGPAIDLDWSQYQDVINIATGRFSPLRGFLTRNDFLKVVRDMTLEDGTVWPLPITLDVDAETAQGFAPGERVALRSPGGTVIGAIEIEEIYKHNEEETIEHVFGTTDCSHPGVKTYLEQGAFFVGGPVYLFEHHRYNDHDLRPAESRVLFRHRGWNTVVGFQTRNAPHRAHEYIQRSALEQTDGLLIQPKLGDKKPEDYTDETIMGAYDALIENYYRPERISLSVFPSKMHYAGPREALFDALVRKNQGCTHFVVGRDHAGVGDYYDEFDAQRIFEKVGDIGIEPVFYDYSFYCDRCDGMTSRKICPHGDEQRVYPSGSEIRQLIRDGEHPPTKVMRPEVAKYIMTRETPFVDKEDKR